METTALSVVNQVTGCVYTLNASIYNDGLMAETADGRRWALECVVPDKFFSSGSGTVTTAAGVIPKWLAIYTCTQESDTVPFEQCETNVFSVLPLPYPACLHLFYGDVAMLMVFPGGGGGSAPISGKKQAGSASVQGRFKKMLSDWNANTHRTKHHQDGPNCICDCMVNCEQARKCGLSVLSEEGWATLSAAATGNDCGGGGSCAADQSSSSCSNAVPVQQRPARQQPATSKSGERKRKNPTAMIGGAPASASFSIVERGNTSLVRKKSKPNARARGKNGTTAAAAAAAIQTKQIFLEKAGGISSLLANYRARGATAADDDADEGKDVPEAAVAQEDDDEQLLMLVYSEEAAGDESGGDEELDSRHADEEECDSLLDDMDYDDEEGGITEVDDDDLMDDSL